ncbi:MAG TPA: prolyl oligopeptidase family serine peptidase, partial [Thermomicrobiales bacterium]|nr:prolyl oligopeptidase family serine peptidase [Thermomicrobiales bacterium]
THPEAKDRTAIWLVPVQPLPAPVVAADEPSADAEATADESSDVAAAAAPVETGDNVAESTTVASTDELPDEAIVAATETEDVEAVAAPEEEPVAEPAPVDERVPVILSDHPTASDRSPRWSPDGQLLAFVRYLDGRDVIALASTDGAFPVAAEILTWSDSHDREPAWSRDGLFLAFTRKLNIAPEHADIIVFVLASGEITNLTGEKTPAIRHSLEWVPGRNLIAFVTRESEWLSIAVINSDNKAGWTVTREAGDKTDPRFNPKEARLVYIRNEGFTSVICERGLHASGALALDPGEGVASFARWGEEKRVVYGFSAPQRPFGFLVQDNLVSNDRIPVNIPGISLTAGQTFRQPSPFEFEVGPEEQFSGLLYRTSGVAGKVPAIVYMPEGPLTTRRGGFYPEEQALASTAMAVLTPVIHGATGWGVDVERDLADYADTEIEISDIAEAGTKLGEVSDIDGSKVAVVGTGYGGALALLAAGARPGIYSAIAAVDPITDWSIEFEEASASWRNWVSRQYGMPLVERDRYAMRSPETFAGTIEVPMLLVSTKGAPRTRRTQLEAFMAYLDEVGVTYDYIDAGDVSLPAALKQVGSWLASHYLEGRESVQVVEELRADDM